jgi:hypothetical protein
MTEFPDWSDPEDIEKRFDEGAQRLAIKAAKPGLRAWIETNRSLGETAELSTSANSDFGKLLGESEHKIAVEAWLPSRGEKMVHKHFLVSREFVAFFDVASVLNNFSPEDDSDIERSDAKRSQFVEIFIEWLCSSCLDETFYARTGEALFNCRYDTRMHRGRSQIWRNAKRFKASLVAEANRFARRNDWRRENRQLAAHFGECFRVLSELIYDLPRGQQISTDASALHLRRVLACGGTEIREGLLTPGVKFDQPGGGSASPTRKALLESVKRHQDVLRGIGVTPDGLKSAFKSMDRKRQRSRPPTNG